MPRAGMDPAVKARLLQSMPEPRPVPNGLSGRLMVVESVRHWIFEGRLRDGDTLAQEDLAEILGMSRIPVRDGLIALEGSGWVAIEPGVGAKAIGLDAASIEDNFEIFNMIWALMIRRAAANGGPREPLLAVSDLVEKAETPTAMVAASDEFVRALSHLAHAPRLEAAYRNAGRIVPGDIFFVVPGATRVQQQHLPQIGRAVVRGDLPAAFTLVASQQAAHVRALIRLLTEKGVLEPGPSFSSGGVSARHPQDSSGDSTGSQAIDWLLDRSL